MNGKDLIVAFGERLRIDREEREMSQRELAKGLPDLSHLMYDIWDNKKAPTAEAMRAGGIPGGRDHRERL